MPPELRDENQGRLREYLTVNRPGRKEDDFLPARVFRAGIDFLDRAGSRQPFALVVDCFDPHEPWDPPYRTLRRYADVRRGQPQPIQPFPSPSALTSTLRPRTVRRARALYSGEVDFVDIWFGHLLDKLDEAGLSENTWVVMLSDHGVMLGERGYIGKSHTQLHKELWQRAVHDPPPRAPAPRYPQRLHGLDTRRRPDASVDGRRAGAAADERRGPERDLRGPQAAAPAVLHLGAEELRVRGGRPLAADLPQPGRRRAPVRPRRNDPREVRNVASRHPAVVRRLYRRVIADSGGRRPPRFKL